VLDKLDRPGGRGSSITQSGHRFDLGPTIITVPQVYEDLWAACGRDFHADVDLRPIDPFYEIRWPDGETFTARQSPRRWRPRSSPLARDVKGYRRFMKDAERRYVVGFEGMLPKPMHRIWETLKVICPNLPCCAPTNRSWPGQGPRARPAPAHGAVVPSALHRRRSDACDLDVCAGRPSRESNLACITRWAGCRPSPMRWPA
jgi:hypothetical protein